MPPLLEWPQQAALHHPRAPQLNLVSFRPRVLLSLQPSPTMPELLPLPLQLLTASAVPRHQLILGVSWRCPTFPHHALRSRDLGSTVLSIVYGQSCLAYVRGSWTRQTR